MNVVLVIAFHIYSFNFVQFCLKRNINEFYRYDYNLQVTNLREEIWKSSQSKCDATSV